MWFTLFDWVVTGKSHTLFARRNPLKSHYEKRARSERGNDIPHIRNKNSCCFFCIGDGCPPETSGWFCLFLAFQQYDGHMHAYIHLYTILCSILTSLWRSGSLYFAVVPCFSDLDVAETLLYKWMIDIDCFRELLWMTAEELEFLVPSLCVLQELPTHSTYLAC